MESKNHTNPLHDISEWKNKEEVAYWKSLATGLYYEKKMLENHLRDVYVELINNKPKNIQCTCDVKRVENISEDKQDEALNYSTSQNVKHRTEFIKKSKKVKKGMYTEPIEEFPMNFPVEEFQTWAVSPQWVPKVINSPRSHNVRQRSHHIKNSKDISKTYVPVPVSKNRSDEMKELYGNHKSQIAGVETALQLNFEHARSQLKPSYWPELQLNLG